MTQARRKAEGRRRKTLCRTAHGALSPAAMTLIELLVAISIVAILATLLLGVAAKAAGTARKARTKQLVSRLHTLVMERYESYRTQRVEINPDTTDANDNRVADFLEARLTSFAGIKTTTFSSPGEWRAAGRLAAIRELMKLEMPDRWSDIVGNTLLPVPDTGDAPNSLNPPNRFFFLRKAPSLNSLYLRRYNEIANDSYINTETGVKNTAGDVRDNQGAECLYLMVMNATSDGEARSLFKESDIGDTDGDGAPEFVDAWGNPIHWLRWAPGYDSDLQISFTSLKRVYGRPTTGTKGLFGADGVEETIANDHDPFDLFQADRFFKATLNATDMTNARGWRLIPLVFSAGSDEELGLYVGDSYLAKVDPYSPITGNQRLGGSSDPDSATDNLTNHHITAK